MSRRLPQPLHRWAFYHWTAYRRWYNKRSFRELQASARRLAASMQRSQVQMEKLNELMRGDGREQ